MGGSLVSSKNRGNVAKCSRMLSARGHKVKRTSFTKPLTLATAMDADRATIHIGVALYGRRQSEVRSTQERGVPSRSIQTRRDRWSLKRHCGEKHDQAQDLRGVPPTKGAENAFAQPARASATGFCSFLESRRRCPFLFPLLVQQPQGAVRQS